MTYFRFVAAIFLLVSLCQVQVTGKKCNPSDRAIQSYLKCTKENENNPFQIIVCMLIAEGMMDESFVINKDKCMESIRNLQNADNDTLEQMRMGYETCFYGFTGAVSESERVLQCMGVMQKLACGEPFACDDKNIKQAQKCEPTPQAITMFLGCMEEEGIPSMESLASEEHSHKLFALHMCVLKGSNVMGDDYVISQENTMKAINEMLITDPDTNAKLTMAYQACFVDFQGTAEETTRILECLDQMKKWACGEAVPDECEATDDADSYCKANLAEIQEHVMACVPASSDGRSATEFSKDELQTSINQNKDQVITCVLTANNMMDDEGVPSREGFCDYFSRILNTDANTLDLLRLTINQCFDDAEPECEQPSDLRIAVWDCSRKFVKKICKKL